MELEIEASHPSNPPHASVLFVHGGWHAAWSFANWRKYFADQGFGACALSLRGHGGSGSPKLLHSVRMGDYVDDVQQAMDQIGEPVILVGHAMGGPLIVEAAVRRPDRVRAIVLLSAFVTGEETKSRKPLLHALHTDKRLLLAYAAATMRVKLNGALHEPFRSPSMARAAFFSPWLPENLVRHYCKNLQPESPLALDEIARGAFKPRVEQVTAPAIVLGAMSDKLVEGADVKETAFWLHTEALFFPGGHDIMLDYAWQQAADKTIAQLARRGIVARA